MVPWIVLLKIFAAPVQKEKTAVQQCHIPSRGSEHFCFGARGGIILQHSVHENYYTTIVAAPNTSINNAAVVAVLVTSSKYGQQHCRYDVRREQLTKKAVTCLSRV